MKRIRIIIPYGYTHTVSEDPNHGSEGSRVNARGGGVPASKEETHLRAAGAPRRYCTAKQLCSTLTQFWQSFSGMRCVTKPQAASHGCPHSRVYNKLGMKPYFMFPTCKGEKFRKLFRRALAPFLVGPSTMHGTPERIDFLIDIVSDVYVLSDKDRITYLAKLVKNIPKEDWQAVQRMMGTSTSEACPKQSAFWDNIPLPTWQWLLPKIAQKATKSRMQISDSIWKALKDLLEQWLPFKVIHSSSTLRRVRIDGMVPNSGFVVDSIVDPRTIEPSGVAFLALDFFKLLLESVMGVIKQTQPVEVGCANLVVGNSEVDSQSARCMVPQLVAFGKENDAMWELIWTKVLGEGTALCKELTVGDHHSRIRWFSAVDLSAHYGMHGLVGQNGLYACLLCTQEFPTGQADKPRTSPHPAILRTEGMAAEANLVLKECLLPYQAEMDALDHRLHQLLEEAYGHLLPCLNSKGEVEKLEDLKTSGLVAVVLVTQKLICLQLFGSKATSIGFVKSGMRLTSYGQTGSAIRTTTCAMSLNPLPRRVITPRPTQSCMCA
jgi:hypothetical protein